MSSSMVEQIARAVLYEGYILYPYRQSALKNQQRWNFGVLYPPAWTATQTGSDRSYFQMECLVRCSRCARVDVSVRFLQLSMRQDGGGEWQEGVERKVDVTSLALADPSAIPLIRHFDFPDGEETAARVVRQKSRLEAELKISVTELQGDYYRLSVRFRNISDIGTTSRNEALLHSFASAHAVLTVHDGEFVSQTDPPEDLRERVAGCQNIGVWPVLVGDRRAHNTMLASPIILCDYPQVAPESTGDLFDSTEIDEILILRILTLTDAEKEEVRRSDERARRILERLESTPAEHLLELHGKIRGMRRAQANDAWSAWDTLEGTPPSKVLLSGIEVKKGDRVRLRPRKRADIFDTLLEGQIAVIETIEEDFESNVQVAVVLENDPGRDLGEMRQIGHRFFFSTAEIEPVDSSVPKGKK